MFDCFHGFVAMTVNSVIGPPPLVRGLVGGRLRAYHFGRTV
jgi:hypothetical protein